MKFSKSFYLVLVMEELIALISVSVGLIFCRKLLS